MPQTDPDDLAPPGQDPVDDVAGAAGIVAGSEFTLSAEALTITPHFGQVGRQAISVGGRVRAPCQVPHRATRTAVALEADAGPSSWSTGCSTSFAGTSTFL